MILSSIFVTVLTAMCTPPSFSTGIIPQFTPSEDSLRIIEKVYLHTDRDSYYPDDDIWFKAYLVDGSDLLLSNHSKNLHVELISPSAEIINSRIVRLDEGMGYGDFRLDEKLKSGRYHLRAYTNYMRNFGDQLFFNKIITVVNPSDAVRIFANSTSNQKHKLEISFFPEGGSLVESVPNVVAFKAVNDTGEGCDVSGEIYSSTGEIVTIFKSTRRGLGTFNINPVPGIDYYAIAKNFTGDSIKKKIPKCFATGIVLNTYRNSANKLLVTLNTNSETLPVVTDQDLKLAVSKNNVIFKVFNIRINDLSNFLMLPVNDLPDGIFTITLSDQDDMPLCERLFYVQNSEDVIIILETNKKVYSQRDSVSVKIALSENSEIAPEAFLSFSAIKNISANIFSRFPTTISSWFLLESDIKGPVEEPSYYFDPSNPNRLKDLDLLLLTQGWRDFEWKYKSMDYPPEDGFKISGRIRKLFVDKPILNSEANIAIFRNGNPIINTVRTDPSGAFSLYGVNFSGTAKLIVSATGIKDEVKGMILLDSLDYLPAEVHCTDRTSVSSNDRKLLTISDGAENSPPIEENLSTFIQYAEFKNSISRKYKLSDTINPGEVTITAKRQDKPESARLRSRHYLFGSPDKEILITPEYEKFGNVKQLFMQRLTVSPRLTRIIFLLDGIRVSGEIFMSVPVSFIDRIDILDTQASIAVFGANTENPSFQDKPANGVFSITTRSEVDFSSDIHQYHTVNTQFFGYNEPRIFYSPKHYTSLESDFKPDLRTTLYWEPKIRLETGKDLFLNYFNGDNPSIVKIVVEGITSSGIPVTGKTEYEVK